MFSRGKSGRSCYYLWLTVASITCRRRNKRPPAATIAPGPGSSSQKALLPGALLRMGTDVVFI